MPSIEQIEMAKYRTEMVDDLQHMIRKYGRIMGWEVPELDEKAARALLFQALKDSLADLEKK